MSVQPKNGRIDDGIVDEIGLSILPPGCLQQAVAEVGKDTVCRKIRLSNKSLSESAAMVVAETLSGLTEVSASCS